MLRYGRRNAITCYLENIHSIMKQFSQRQSYRFLMAHTKWTAAREFRGMI